MTLKYDRNKRDIVEHKTMHVVGLTGGIASGKSQAQTALSDAGFNVIDADDISRRLFARGTNGEALLMREFEYAVSDGALNRKALRDAIAKDPRERAKLNALTHPAVIAEIKRQITSSFCVVSAPLLFESALSALCDAVVCVVCPRDLRIARLTARDGINSDAAIRIIDAQIHDCVRATLSDYCVPSDRPLSEFCEEIVELFNVLRKGAK